MNIYTMVFVSGYICFSLYLVSSFTRRFRFEDARLNTVAIIFVSMTAAILYAYTIRSLIPVVAITMGAKPHVLRMFLRGKMLA